jgi:hypothetical protein
MFAPLPLAVPGEGAGDVLEDEVGPDHEGHGGHQLEHRERMQRITGDERRRHHDGAILAAAEPAGYGGLPGKVGHNGQEDSRAQAVARRRTTAWPARLLLALLGITWGCDSGLEPGEDAPPLGRYAFTVDAGLFEHAGALVLTYATPDSIAGRWDAPAVNDSVHLGFRNVDAYVVGMTDQFAGIAFLRLALDEDTGLRCAGVRFVEAEGSTPGTCTVAKE